MTPREREIQEVLERAAKRAKATNEHWDDPEFVEFRERENIPYHLKRDKKKLETEQHDD